MQKLDYQTEYDEFIESYKSGATTGENIGFKVSRMAQYFAGANLEYATALQEFNKVLMNFEGTTDASGKTISSSKANSLANATPESNRLIEAKAHVENIEQILNALKCLQKGILQEQGYMAST